MAHCRSQCSCHSNAPGGWWGKQYETDVCTTVHCVFALASYGTRVHSVECLKLGLGHLTYLHTIIQLDTPVMDNYSRFRFDMHGFFLLKSGTMHSADLVFNKVGLRTFTMMASNPPNMTMNWKTSVQTTARRPP